MFVLALVVLGLKARSRMPQEQNPKIDIPYITVLTTYGGAGPNEIETLVSQPIEKAVTSTGNLKNVTSTSQDGLSSVTLEFELGTDLEAAAADVRDKVSAIRQTLPKDADEPRILKLDISAMPIMVLGLAGPLPPKEMRILADDVISDRLSKVGGVAAVNVSGGEQRELSVGVDRDRLDAYGVGIGSVVDALRGANLNLPAGSIKEGPRDYSIRTVGEYANAREIADTRLSLPGGSGSAGGLVRIGDIAEVRDTVAEPDSIVRLNGQPTVVLSIQKQSDANTVAVADGIKGELAAMQSVLPTGVHAVISSDQSAFVKQALHDVNTSLLEGVLLVVLIVFLFLHTARATFIVAVAIPTSLFATYIPISAFGFTQNQMVLLALSLVVGILVDDSIVVLENISRHLRLREGLREAALNGRSEIGLAAIAITMVDVVVFLPIAFMGGIVGEFFRQFGITVAVATSFSLLMSFTLTPMLASRWMKSEEAREADEEVLHRRRREGALDLKDRLDLLAGWLFGGLERFLRGLDRRYRGVLEWSLQNRFLTIAIGGVSLLVVLAMAMPPLPFNVFVSHNSHMLPLHAVVAAAPRLAVALVALGVAAAAMAVNRGGRKVAMVFGLLTAFLALTVSLPFGFGFFPAVDQGDFGVSVRTPPGSSLLATDHVVREIEAIVSRVPEVKTVQFRVSDAAWYNPFTWLRHHTESQTGYYVSSIGSGSSSVLGGVDSGPQYAAISGKVVDKGHRRRSIQQIVDAIAQQTARIPGAELISVSASAGGGPSNNLSKEVQGQYMDDIVAEANRSADVMRKVPGTVDVDISYKPRLPERRVIVDRLRAAELGMTLVDVASSARVAIDGDDTVKFRDSGTEYPIRVHYALAGRSQASDLEGLIIGTRDGAPVRLSDVAKVDYNYAPTKIERKNGQRVIYVTANLATGAQLGNINQAFDAALKKSTLVPGTTVGTGGSTQMMTESFGYMGASMLLAIILVYMLMGALFESFLTPFVIMFTLPQAMTGALLALLMTGNSMSIVAMVGLVMLMGLVTKNAILLIDYTNTLMGRGRNRHDALLEAGPTRLRPILMTTFAMIGGMLPTALALSQGSETRSPMAIAVIGGLALSTLLTLIVIPVTFTLVDDVWHWVLRRFFPGAYLRAREPADVK
jgi:HAE1 family hydrophobic/amphiphilic exporter-1